MFFYLASLESLFDLTVIGKQKYQTGFEILFTEVGNPFGFMVSFKTNFQFTFMTTNWNLS